MKAMAAMKAMKPMKKRMKKRNVTYYHNSVTGRNSGFKDNATRPNWRKVAAAKALKEAEEKEKKKQARAQKKKEKEQALTKTVQSTNHSAVAEMQADKKNEDKEQVPPETVQSEKHSEVAEMQADKKKERLEARRMKRDWQWYRRCEKAFAWGHLCCENGDDYCMSWAAYLRYEGITVRASLVHRVCTVIPME